MKTLKIICTVCIILLSFIVFSSGKGENNGSAIRGIQDTLSYIDGTYSGESKASYTSEPFWGHVNIKIEAGLLAGVDFVIRDSSLHEIVDSMYGVIHYSEIPMYMQQCVNEDHAIRIYPQRLLQSQNIDEIDAISGATWSYNIFIASSKNALKDAIISSGTVDHTVETARISVKTIPNPFHSAVTMEYHLEDRCHVNLKIFDSQGKMVKQLVDELQTAGRHMIKWDDCLSEGIYFYQMQADNQMICNKIINR